MLFAGMRRGPVRGAPPAIEGSERLSLRAGTTPVDALYMPPRVARGGAGNPVALFAHGNAELIEDWPAWLERARPDELAILLVELPGYGWSQGRASPDSALAALQVGYDWLAARADIDRDRILGYGRSLGGGLIGLLARTRPLAGLVLSSTFTSLRPFAKRMLLPTALLEDPLDTLSVVERFAGPVLVIHGRNDELIAFSHGERLAAANARARLLSYPAGHNDCPPDPKAFAPELARFLREHGFLD